MPPGEDVKKLERRAKAMLINKEIPQTKMDIVRTLMTNESLKQGERFRAIIDLIESCPDKKVVLYEENEGQKVQVKKDQPKKRSDLTAEAEKAPELSAPTETSYYIENLLKKYRHLRIFKKRYLVHRSNRFGIGLRKRLIPTKHLLKILELICRFQEIVVKELAVILMEILNDETVDDPTEFNYLKLIRRWLAETPLIGHRYDDVKWMERFQFEREFKTYVTAFYSFLKFSTDTREKIILAVESKLRGLEELKKDEVNDEMPDGERREKDKKNLAKEKTIYDYMMLIRSFLPNEVTDATVLSKRLKTGYAIESLPTLLYMIQEALVFQRPIKAQDIINYYQVEAPVVSSVEWDYSEEMLRKVGKDRESRRKKRRDVLRKDLEPYETIAMMLKYDNEGQNVLLKAAEDQWRHVDKKNYDAKTVYNENFFNFLDGLVHYFKNAFLPLIDGSSIVFRDSTRIEFEGTVFSFNYFQNEIGNFNSVLDEMHFFRSNNPTQSISRDEVRKILTGQADTDEDIGPIIVSAGECFYLLAKELQRLYDLHKKWVFNGSVVGDQSLIRSALSNRGIDPDEGTSSKPVPYYDCTFRAVENSTVLTKDLIGKNMLEDSLQGGILVHMIAFCYQVAYECMNERLLSDLDERKNIIKAIENAVE